MSIQGVINRIRRQVGLPASAPRLGADELQLDPATGVLYYLPDGGGVVQAVQPKSLSGVCEGAWEEEETLAFYPDVLNTVPGVITLGRVGVGEYYLVSSGAVLSGVITVTGQYNGMMVVFMDAFNVRLAYGQVGAAPAGAPGGSIGLYIRRADTDAKQELNGSFRLRVFY